MISIATLITVETRELKEFVAKSGVSSMPKSRHELELLVFSLVAEKGLLKEADFLKSPYFSDIYSKKGSEIAASIKTILPTLETTLITRLQAVCLLCLQVQAEPFASYLSDNLDETVFEYIYKLQPYTTVHFSQRAQRLVVRGLLASRASKNRKELQSSIEASAEGRDFARQTETKVKEISEIAEQFQPVLFTTSIWEQVQELMDFCVRLHRLYQFSPYVSNAMLYSDYTCSLRFSIDQKVDDCVSILAYLTKNPKRYEQIYEKLLTLFRSLNDKKLFLAYRSLDDLLIDTYENIWIVRIVGSRILKDGRALETAIENIVISWNKELKAQHLTLFSYEDVDQDEESIDVESFESEDLENLPMNVF